MRQHREPAEGQQGGLREPQGDALPGHPGCALVQGAVHGHGPVSGADRRAEPDQEEGGGPQRRRRRGGGSAREEGFCLILFVRLINSECSLEYLIYNRIFSFSNLYSLTFN